MFDGSCPDKWFMEISNTLRFTGNRGIGPVSLFESNLRYCNDFIFSKFVGNVPLIPLFDKDNDVAFEKVVANQSGSLSNIDVLEMSSSRILTWDCNQVGNRGPIWQDSKPAHSSLKGGSHSGPTAIFNELSDKSICFNFF
jgi:hypothetical protein